VQNRYNVDDREWENVLEYCERESIAFIPWYPLKVGKVSMSKAEALAWLLKRSPVMLPIPGTSKVKHLEENMKALDLMRQ
jgi:aryl-alcohol dehydrogenase-like predicted oxidoreductase